MAPVSLSSAKERVLPVNLSHSIHSVYFLLVTAWLSVTSAKSSIKQCPSVINLLLLVLAHVSSSSSCFTGYTLWSPSSSVACRMFLDGCILGAARGL